MGFYGNITNTARSTFQFDKIYPSRKTMDAQCNEDGVYNGRYVLVEYDTSLSNESYYKPWYILKKSSQLVDGEEVEGAHNKIYAAPPSTINNSIDENFYDLTTLGARLSKEDLISSVSTIYLDKARIFSNYNEESKLIVFNKNGEVFEDSIDNLAIFDNCWNPLPTSPINPDLDELKNYFEDQQEQALINMGVYPVCVVNGSVKCPVTIDWSQLDPTEQYVAGFVKTGCWYDYNLKEEMWQLVSPTYLEENDGVTTEYFDIQPLSDSTEDTFTKNFNEDKAYYGNSRGYDSTVWQKVFVNGVEKYVMIAELNSVVPTFGISADPPSLLPINPHWGSDTTNVYYELHWQPQWGFRVKAADSDLVTQTIDTATGTLLDGVNSSGYDYGYIYLRLEDKTQYPSDENVIWKNYFEVRDEDTGEKKKIPAYYDGTTQKWTTERTSSIPAAIYYNKAGFNPEYIHYSTDLKNEVYPDYNPKIAASDWNPNLDSIGFTPTGLSGNLYNRHDGYFGKKPQVDTQEFSLMLPSIGNIAAKIWDMVYGGRDLNILNIDPNRRNTNIEWENGPKHLQKLGIRLRRDNEGNLYDTDAMLTLAGCINTTHDLLGMIIVDIPAEECQNYRDTLDEESGLFIHPDLRKLREDRIYFLEDIQQYCRKALCYDFYPLREDQYEYESVIDYGQLTQEIINNGQYYVQIQKSGNNQPTITKYVNVIDLVTTFAEANEDNIYSGDSFTYAIETTETNNQWSIQNKTFFLTYTYDIGLQYNVKYYYKTINELFEEVEGDVKNYPFTDNQGNIYNYYRESAEGTITGDNPNYNYFKTDEFVKDVEENDYFCVIPGNPIQLDGIYRPDKYYYITRDPNTGVTTIQKDSSNIAVQGRTYYEIDEEAFLPVENNIANDNLQMMYLPGRYYYKVVRHSDSTHQLGAYLLDWTVDGSDIQYYGERVLPDGTVIDDSNPATLYSYRCYNRKATYSEISDNGNYEIYIESSNYEQISINESEYLPNIYYINNNDLFVLDASLNFDSNKVYYKRSISYIKRTNDNTYNIDEVLNRNEVISIGQMSFYQDNTYFYRIDNADGTLNYYKSMTISELLTQTADPLSGNYDPSRIYYLEKKNEAITNACRYHDLDWYIINRPTVIHPAERFYIPNTYHYKSGDNYIFSTTPDKIVGRQYYLIQVKSLNEYLETNDTDLIFAQSEDLYYKENDEYIKIEDFDDTQTYPGGTLYNKKEIYVYSDETPNVDDRLKRGMEWNTDALCIPPTVTLSTRKEYYALKELPYFAIDSSTINGIILKTTQTLAEGDKYTRDLSLVSGALNKVQDLIAKFNKIKSQELTIVDDAGRIHSAPIETWQTVNINDVPTQKRWLTSIVNGDLANPKVTINHIYNPEGDTNLNDLNMNNYDNPNTQAIESDHIDSIQIAKPKIDEMGHVVGFNNQKVIFPYAFGKIYLNNTTVNDPLLEAVSTHDYLILQGDDWTTLGFIDKKLNITHAAPIATNGTIQAGNVATGDNTLTVTAHSDIALKHGQSFKVPYEEIDSKGHTTTLKQDTITLSQLATTSNYTTIASTEVPLQVVKSASFSQPTTGDNAGKDVLDLSTEVIGKFPLGLVSTYNYPTTLPEESTDLIKISNRLTKLTTTETYARANTLSELTAIEFQRTKWLTEILQTVDMEATLNLQSEFTDLRNEVDTINVAIGNNTIYTPDDPETTDENEQRRVTIQQLTSRVAQLEEVIRRLISVDENNNSLVVLSNDEIDEILDWDRITNEPTITVTFIHSVDNQNTDERDYLISDWVRRGHFAAYAGNNTVKYYVLNQELQAYEEIVLPFAITRAFVNKYGQMAINEDEGQVTIIEALTTPSL